MLVLPDLNCSPPQEPDVPAEDSLTRQKSMLLINLKAWQETASAPQHPQDARNSHSSTSAGPANNKSSILIINPKAWQETRTKKKQSREADFLTHQTASAAQHPQDARKSHCSTSAGTVTGNIKFDQQIGLSNAYMINQINGDDMHQLLRKRKSVPETALGMWKFSRAHQNEGLLHQPFVHGMCYSLQHVHLVEESASSSSSSGIQQAQHKELPNTHRFAAYVALKALSKFKNAEIEKEDKKLVADILHTGIRTVERIWKVASEQTEQGLAVDVSNQKKGNVGRKRKDLGLSRINTIALNRRKTIRSLAKSLDVSCTALYRRFQWGEIKRHSSSLKPSLKPANKVERLKFCLSMLDEATLGSARPSFSDMSHIVHIDEKWFNMTQKNNTYYLLPEEEDPLRTIHNKNCIGKVMFLTAVARPRFDKDGCISFDGKIGVWPFVKEIPAVRRSENRERGTLELKSIIVNREVMREYLCDKVIPAILDLWPQDDVGTIFIQQDNARTHVLPKDKEFQECVELSGLDLRLMQQPPNSPDLNVLDLGFFNSIKSLADCRGPNTIRDLIAGVEEEFENYDVLKLSKVFLTLQSCMIEVMKCEGGIGYKIPHQNKEKLQREGRLHDVLNCDGELVQRTMELVGQH